MWDTLKTSWIFMICSWVSPLLFISGPVVAVAGAIDMDQASSAVDTAREQVDRYESQIRTNESNVSTFENLISKAERDIRDADCKLHQTNTTLQHLSGRREVLADVQNKMRTAVNRLGVLAGVGSVAELQTRHLVLLEPLVKVLEQMTTALDQMTGKELLTTRDIKRLVRCMKRNQKELKCLADANQKADYVLYY